MNLVDEYLRAVGLLLPKATRDDILAELRDLVLTRIEAKEAALGRPLTEAETEALLREVGHPIEVAGRYGEGPRHVVGPALYPYWLFGVKAALAILCVVLTVGFVIKLAGGAFIGQAMSQTFSSAFQGGITIVGFATVGAWLVERRMVKTDHLADWRVRDLRVLEIGAWDWDAWRARAAGGSAGATAGPGAATPAAPVVRERRGAVGDGLGDIAWGLVLLLWWTGALHVFGGDLDDLRGLGLEPGELANFDWAALKALIFAPVLLYTAAVMAQGVLLLMRPEARRLHGALNVGIGAGVVALSAWLAYASPLAADVAVDSVAELIARTRATFGDGAPYALAGVLSLVLAISAVGGVSRVLRGLWQLLAPAPIVRSAPQRA